MRKTACLLLALTVLLAAGVIVSACAIAAPRADVRFQEDVRYGDPSAASGAAVSLRASLQNHLVWDSDIAFSSGDYTYKTDHTFSAAGVAEQTQRVYAGVEFYSAFDFAISGDYSLTLDYGSFFNSLYDDLLAETTPGTTGSRIIRLADYFDYYPFEIDLSLPGLELSNPRARIEGNTSQEQAVTEAFLNFFRIPVLSDQYLELNIDRDMDGGSHSRGTSSVQTGDWFDLYSNSITGPNACYFWFSNRTNKDACVDTSLIPGGYGVYILPFSTDADDLAASVDLTGLRTFYPVDPETRIRYLGITADCTQLLLHTVEDGQYFITIIDAETGDTLQRLELGAFDVQEDWTAITDGDDFTCIRVSDKRLFVLHRQPDGLWRIAIDTALLPLEQEEDYFPWWDGTQDMAFDGERLVVAGFDRYTPSDGSDWMNYRYEECGFYLAVYTAGGLQYYGVYPSSLEDANDHSQQTIYSGTQIQPRSIRVHW